MTQTTAIFVDAYRNLNSKKMFWVVLAISLLVAGAFAAVGINEKGISIVGWQLDNDLLNSGIIPAAMFYKILFVSLGIGFWLTILATILALISTSGIFPDLINSRSVDLLVAKPISRLRLFVLQYTAGLLFVALQVSLFTLACFLVLGFRGGAWEWSLFVAVPLVVVFFSYLFSVSVLVGILTRSTMAALLLTLLFWAAVFGVGIAETVLLQTVTRQEEGVTLAQMRRGPHHRRDTDDSTPAAKASSKPTTDSAKTSSAPDEKPTFGKAIGKSALAAFAAEEKKPEQNDPEEEDTGLTNWEIAQRILYGIKTFLPKTTETMGLLERCLISQAELTDLRGDSNSGRNRVERKTEEALRSRSVFWVMGTSLLFELVVLSMAAWVFCRRDY